MGFKKNDVLIEQLGVTVPEAYAQIEQLRVDLDGACSVCFKVQTARETMDRPALENKFVRLTIDKNLPVHKQVYEYAKREVFADWEDDIPVDSGLEAVSS
ncbi:MAG: hypothetical protein J6A56_04350 [Clostridia bacterium]|nr:hypothetical protein [Clostridia bacterium]